MNSVAELKKLRRCNIAIYLLGLWLGIGAASCIYVALAPDNTTLQDRLPVVILCGLVSSALLAWAMYFYLRGKGMSRWAALYLLAMMIMLLGIFAIPAQDALTQLF